MTARSPRSSAAASSSRIAVDLPVPVVPISLKCLTSSLNAMPTPAIVSGGSGRRSFNRAARLCAERPSRILAPRLCASWALDLRESTTEMSSTRANTASTRTRCQEAAFQDSIHGADTAAALPSIALYDQIVSTGTVGRSRPIDPDAQPRLRTAGSDIHEPAPLLQA